MLDAKRRIIYQGAIDDNWSDASAVKQHLLGDAIEALKAQDYPELEIVVVDNGSTDFSREVIAAHVAGDGHDDL